MSFSSPKRVIIATVLVFCAVSTVSAWSSTPKANVLDALRCGSSFSILKAAINKAGLTESLTSPDAEITLFAPTNAAFASALSTLNITAEQLLESDALGDILKYHVVGKKVDSEDLQSGEEALTTLFDSAALKATIEKNADGDKFFVNDAEVIVDDILTENGIVHIIDTVLLPPIDSAQKKADMELIEEAAMKNQPILG